MRLLQDRLTPFEREFLKQILSPIEMRIAEIGRLLKFREGIKSEELESYVSNFLKFAPDEIRTLENKEVSGLEYTRRRAILRFSLCMLKIYFESVEQLDLVNKTETLITRIKRL